MTPYEILDKSYKHLIKQKSRATNKKGTICKYRTEDGKSCAVGCLVDDKTAKKWDKESADSSIAGIVSTYTVPDWIADNVDLLTRMQLTHDSMSDGPFAKYYITDQYNTIAKDFNIEIEFS